MEISVIIPTRFPSEKLLGHCLLTLAQQTLPRERFEVLIVQNGESAEGREYLCRLPDIYPSLQLHILFTKQAGVSGARNYGMDVAQGRYLCFIDDDDWVSEDYLEKLLAEADERTVPAAYVIAKHQVEGEEERDYVGDAYLRLYGQDKISILQGRRLLATVWGKLLPVGVIGGQQFDVRFSMGEDALFMAAISKNIENLRPAEGKPTYYRRLTDNSATRSSKTIGQRAQNLLKLWSAYLSVYWKLPLKYDFLFFANRMVAVTKWFFMWRVR